MKRVSNRKRHRPEEIVAISCEAFEDDRLGAMHLTKLEIEAIRSGKPIATTNKREISEFQEKCARLGVGNRAR